MTFDGIRVHHASLDTASTDLQTAANRIRTRLETLEADLAPLAAQWTGQAQRSYVLARTAWDTAMAEMVALLAQVSVAVAESNAAYREADQRGAARFG